MLVKHAVFCTPRAHASQRLRLPGGAGIPSPLAGITSHPTQRHPTARTCREGAGLDVHDPQAAQDVPVARHLRCATRGSNEG